MNKNEYLKILDKNLRNLDYEEKKDILNEYETHFYSGLQEGRTEDQISDELGNPKMIARDLNANEAVKKASTDDNFTNISSALLAVMGLGVLNFFIILVPAVFIISLLFSLLVFTIISLASPFFLLMKGIMEGFNEIINYDIYSAGLLFGIGLMLIPLTIYICKGVTKLTINYLKWNVSVVKRSVK
ncbi:DUF1700 domain-containing protein [Staphylococcus sp. NRL 16/872]|uniref:HAAS signaling domain-containing protein n=1 Tax=Staphylococcus sp. NRL 16/872 TaxID=2930131 RepID=UPI001FB3FF1F|nr:MULTISPECIES: DUF1700 domain-containing protein [unclassified Staphylococcus]MCJ1655722.1 DUF1700 domain-containing protein [Staphylococcus sp. NRL 21/187]MCJ1661539.1 DUF1700 domain-containing protein [Staphylococcus sp. NRL 18/288]WEN69936.1 DUF1700 domain-containing protein [Staphylococcus sp. NRL 16/872]